jgi:signal-transduction protein with cAMP-binding, CBS, and nucleotidyltransferase domain
MKVEDILKEKGDVSLITVEEDISIDDAIELLDTNKVGSLIVIDKDANVSGIVSERDFLYKPPKLGDRKSLKVKDLMTGIEDLYIAKKTDKPSDLMKLIVEKKIRHIPIMEDDTIVGLVSIGDLMKYLLKKYEEEAFLLRQHIKNPMGIHVYGNGK